MSQNEDLKKEEAIEKVLLRPEAEEFLEMTKANFQFALTNGKIPVMKKVTLGKGNTHTYLFWKPDLKEFKKARDLYKRK